MTDEARSHDLVNERSLRRDIEALLQTYDEVVDVWPQGKCALDARLSDGRTIRLEYWISFPDGRR